MKTFQHQFKVLSNSIAKPDFDPDIVLIFGSRFQFEGDAIELIQKTFSNSTLFGCSTSGEISNHGVSDNSIVYTCIKFENENSSFKYKNCKVEKPEDSFHAGSQLSKGLYADNLKHILILSDGQSVNGSELVKGISENLPESVTVTGGLAGDGDRFEQTYVIDENGYPKSGIVSAIGLYGDHFQIAYGSAGGWTPFGIERKVTRSEGNILYEIDGSPALELYKYYLGDNVKNLPSSALLFPINMRVNANSEGVVRTILNVNEKDNSLIFAGDIPNNSLVQLMKSTSHKLIDGAEQAANITLEQNNEIPELAFFVSCIGRKLVMKQLTDEEVEIASDKLSNPTVTGFYSYGEIAPFKTGKICELHNQTMTITTIKE